ncbi:hypothetical protein PVAP13_6NG172703 [Panicum virgatum]|uniref:Uncharacterized protein n=1 Tax=Panicum virgatum TaxID=38727 RepID=A0A8T0QXK9_PANVG|nr:hypothetical protein PVAP13_6NG172703 [Panicum virgatum]
MLTSSTNDSSQAINLTIYYYKDWSSSSRFARHVTSRRLTLVRLRCVILAKNHQTPCNRFIRLSLTALINLCDHFHHKESASPCSRKSSDALPLPHRAPRRSENQAIALMPHKKNSPSILYLWISCSHSIFYVGATSEVT